MTPDQQRPPPPATSPSWVPAILGALSFVSCCFPLGLVGAGFGLRGLLRAKKEGRSPPLQSIAAIVLGLLSLGSFSWLAVTYQRDSEATLAQKSAALDKVATSRKAEQLDALTACTLAEAFLLDTQGVGAATVTCPLPLRKSEGAAASLPGVIFERAGRSQPRTVCFVRSGGSWMAWGGLRFGECPEPPTGDDEKALRAAAQPVLQKALMATWKRALARLDSALDEDAQEKCPKLEGEVRVLDAEGLGGKVGPEEWDFLNSTEFVNALRYPTAERAEDALENLGQYVVLLEADDRVLPEDVSDDSFSPGSWEGSLFIVEVSSAKAVCGAPLSFTNSATLGGGVKVGLKIGPKVGVGEESAQGNFEKNGEAAIDAVVRGLSGGHLSVRH